MYGIFRQNKNEIMRVLCILTIYNEMKYLPLKVEFCKQNKLELYIIDNMSTDGSWEWLQEYNIPSHRLDTNESFDLRKLQKETIKTIHKEKPDWVVYNGCDLFPVTLKPLHDVIKKADKKGDNCMQMKLIRLANTGEKKNNDPFNTYFYYDAKEHKERVFIHKYYPGIRYGGDKITLPTKKKIFFTTNKKEIGIMLEYGDTKSKKERNETFKRRKMAWKNGLNKNFGSHYRRGAKRNWIRSKEGLKDIRKSKYAPYVKKLYEVGNIVGAKK